MEFPIEVVFRDMDALPVTEEKVRERILGLGQPGERIESARVVVERTHHRHVRGNPFKITIYLSVPGDDIVVSHEPQTAAALRKKETTERKRKSDEAHPEDKHFDVALRKAVDRARRQVDAHVRKRRQRQRNARTT